jgi:hypothetical protein
MDVIRLNGRITVDNFYKKFEAMYPFLNPALFYPETIGGGEVDTSSTIANARARSLRQDIVGYSSTLGAEIDITPDTLISTLQSEIEKQFGICCYINCRIQAKGLFGLFKGDYQWQALDNTPCKNMTLGEANAHLQKNGAQEVSRFRTNGKDLGKQFL